MQCRLRQLIGGCRNADWLILFPPKEGESSGQSNTNGPAGDSWTSERCQWTGQAGVCVLCRCVASCRCVACVALRRVAAAHSTSLPCSHMFLAGAGNMEQGSRSRTPEENAAGGEEGETAPSGANGQAAIEHQGAGEALIAGLSWTHVGRQTANMEGRAGISEVQRSKSWDPPSTAILGRLGSFRPAVRPGLGTQATVFSASVGSCCSRLQL